MNTLPVELEPQIRKLVARAASKHSRARAAQEDLVQEALLGAWQALPRVEPARGNPVAFLMKRAHGALVDALRKDGGALGVSGASSFIRRGLGLPEKVARPVALEATHPDGSRLVDPVHPRSGEELRAVEDRDEVEALLSRVTPRERKILRAHSGGVATLAEAAKLIGVSESRACQISGGALARLRADLRNREEPDVVKPIHAADPHHAAAFARDAARIAAELARLGPDANRGMDAKQAEKFLAASVLRCPARQFAEGFACGAIPASGELFCPKHAPAPTERQPHKPKSDKAMRPADVQLDTKLEPKAVQTDNPIAIALAGAPDWAAVEVPAATPPSEATVTATKETEMTATAAPPVKAAEKKPDRRPCGCGLTGRHLATCKLAPKPAPGKYVCACGKDCLTPSGLGGHRSWCERKSKGALAAKAALERAAPAAAWSVNLAADTPLIEAPKPYIPPSMLEAVPRGPIVRMHKADIEVECATVEDAAAFVRAMQAGK